MTGEDKNPFTPDALAKISAEQIQSYLSQRENVEESLLSLLENDPRQSVKAIARRWRRDWERKASEKKRLEGLFSYECKLWAKGINWVAGVDEAGRGPLAGPVVAAAVILPPYALLPGLNDSKKLSPAKRESLFDLIRQTAVAVGVGLVHAEEIDKINILQATYKAMTQAVKSLSPAPQYLLVDGREIPDQVIPQRGIVHGDSLSASIAAASIIAKVTRDRIMEQYDLLFPEYGFAQHKGYGTKEHLEAIKKYGPCPLHRRCFKGVMSH